MARLLVLRFEDDEFAEDFIKASGRDTAILSDLYREYTIEAAFQMPTKFCNCAHRGDGWRHSGKHNWWLHHSCGRPSVGWGSNIRTIIATGHDLTENQTKQNTQERIDMVGMRCPECGQPREGYE